MAPAGLGEWFVSKLTPGALPIYGIFIMLATFLVKEWRENRKLSAEDRQARREGFEAQLAGVREELKQEREENRQLGSDLRDLRAEYDTYRRLCIAETAQLRQYIVDVESDVSGTKRQLAMQAIQLGRVGNMIPPSEPKT